jgi:hypothetical protein
MTTLDAKAHYNTPTPPITFSQVYKDTELYAKEMRWSREFRGIVATIQKPMARHDRENPFGILGALMDLR